jgi:hypothetical protein
MVLDEFINTTLPETIAKRGEEGDPFVTHKEISEMMKWKMLHKFRPNLQTYIDKANDAQVKMASESAFKELKSGNLKNACLALKVLKGCGPALSSLVLSAYDGSLAAYMSDPALEAVCGSRGYSLAEFIELTTQLKARAVELGGSWTAQKLQKVIWTIGIGKQLGYDIKIGSGAGNGSGAGAGTGASSSAGSSASSSAGAGSGAGADSGAGDKKLSGSKRTRGNVDNVGY